MYFNFAILSSFLFALIVLADSHSEDQQSGSLNRVERPANAASDGVIYSYNWSGAFWEKGNGTFNFVSGTFTVPIPKGKSGSAAAVWTGIDGAKCISLFHVGVNLIVTEKGTSYNAWYEWYPDSLHYFSDVPISAGDTIRLTISASSATSGTAFIENLTNTKSAFKYIQSTHALCGQSAEWIVEDYRQGGDGNFVPFANFDTVTFTDAVATGTSTYTPDGATIVNIEQNNQILTSAWTNGSSVTVKYV